MAELDRQARVGELVLDGLEGADRPAEGDGVLAVLHACQAPARRRIGDRGIESALTGWFPELDRSQVPESDRVFGRRGDLPGRGHVQVVFNATGGSPNPSRVMTDAKGQAATHWTLGSAAGDETITAVVKGTGVSASGTVRATKPSKK